MHSFAKEQPDLNWENETVREKIYEMICWWMDQGLSGFRIDAIMNIKKDLTWSNLKPDGPDGLADVYKITGKVEGIGDFLMEMKHRCFEPYDALTVGGGYVCKKKIFFHNLSVKTDIFLRFLHLNHAMPIGKAKII